MHEYTVLYPLEVCSVLRRFVKVRMRPLDLFLDRPSDRDICNRAPADGLLSPLHTLSTGGKHCLPQCDLDPDVALDS